MTLSQRSLKTLRKFAAWGPEVEMFPNGRAIISYRKRTELSGRCAVEVWTDHRPEEATCYKLKPLLAGFEVHAQPGQKSALASMDRALSERPNSSFQLSRLEIGAMKAVMDRRASFQIRLDSKSDAGTEVNDQYLTAKVSIAHLNGEPCEISMPLPLVKALPVEDYWVKIFRGNLAVIEATSGQFVIYSYLTEVRSLGGESTP